MYTDTHQLHSVLSMVSHAYQGFHTDDAASRREARNGLDRFLFMLFIGCHVKFDTRATKIMTPPSLCENPLSCH